MPYSLNDDLTPEQFEELGSSGSINPAATYQDYLELKQERMERAAEAHRLGLTGDDSPELTPELSDLLNGVWSEVARERSQPATQAA